MTDAKKIAQHEQKFAEQDQRLTAIEKNGAVISDQVKQNAKEIRRVEEQTMDRFELLMHQMNAGFARVETGLKEEINQVETGLKEEITRVETGLKEDINRVETGLKKEISQVETGFLSLNGSYSDAIDAAGDEDWYEVTVVESGTLTVYSTGNTDVYGHLLSSSGSELTSNDDGGESTNFRISHSVSEGTYYVRVRHYSTADVGDYGITSSFTDSFPSSGGSSSGGVVGFSANNWERAVISAGTTHNSILTTPVDAITIRRTISPA